MFPSAKVLYFTFMRVVWQALRFLVVGCYAVFTCVYVWLVFIGYCVLN